MRIGIDISQIVHEGTGVGRYVREMVKALLKEDKINEYILFGSSLRMRHIFFQYFDTVRSLNKTVRLVVIPLPPTILDYLWNRLHIVPVEWLIGNIDLFWSSDWTQPPLQRAKGVTTVHDLIALKYPNETDEKIVAVHKRRFAWVAKECQTIFCDSETTKEDVFTLLRIRPERLRVMYPGVK